VPGGYVGLTLITVAPAAVIILAIVSQIVEEGLESLWLALAAIAVGAVLYFPIRKIVKPSVPDVDPFEAETETA
jgi:Kef-type K+ transport system membrane component KefB